MIGKRVESRPSFPVMGVLLSLLTLALLALAAWLPNIHLAIGAIVPGIMAAGLFLSRDPQIAIVFTEEGLEHESAGTAGSIPYHAIESVWTPRRKMDPTLEGARSYPIVIGHADGELRLSGKLDAPSDSVYRHLLGSVPIGGSDEVHDDLAEYLAEQRAEFGDDHVWSYRAALKQIGPNYRRLRAVMLATILGGLIWVVIGAVTNGMGNDTTGWIVGGTLVMVSAGLFWMASFLSSNPGTKFKGWKESSLVVGPLGLALVQGNVRGEMKWNELREVKLIDAGSFRLRDQRTAGRGMLLRVEGAGIFVPDIYDRPLYAIHQAILHYWR